MSDKTTINRESLLKIAGLVRPALATQNYIPALTHIKFDGNYATAYNDVSAISVRAQVDINRCLPGELLIRSLGSFGAESVMLQENAKDSTILLSSGRSKLKIPTLEPKAFPFDLDDDGGDEIGLDHAILKGVERCLLSVGNDPTHPAQMGVTLDIDDRGCAVLYSTDNFSISRYQTKTKIKLPGDVPVIMPTFFCEQLITLAKAFNEEEMMLVLLNGALLVEYGKAAKLFSKTLVDLSPLDYPRIVAKNCKLDDLKKQLTAIPDSFDAALSRALLVLAGEVDKATKVTITDGSLKLNSTSPMGDSDDSMKFESDADESIGEPFYFDPALIARASKVCGLIGFMPKVVVLADPDIQFVHLVAHCKK